MSAAVTSPTRRRRPVRALEPSRNTIGGSYALLFVACLVAVVPFLYIVSTSFKDTASLFHYPPDWIPSPLFLGNYVSLIAEHPFLRWVFNTLFVATAVTVIKVVIDAMAAYALAKLPFTGKGAVSTVLLLSVAVPIAALIIPLFFFVRSLGLFDSYLALILPPLANPLGIFMIRSFIVSLPDDLDHSARLDGASEFGIFAFVILPLIKPGLVVLAVFTFLLQYTSFLWPLVIVRDPSIQILTVGVSSLKAIFLTDWGLISAALLLSAVPITLMFVFMQRFFLAQDLAGALKE